MRGRGYLKVSIFFLVLGLLSLAFLIWTINSYGASLDYWAHKDMEQVVYQVCLLYQHEGSSLTAHEIFEKVLRPVYEKSVVCKYYLKHDRVQDYKDYTTGLMVIAAKTWYELMHGTPASWLIKQSRQ